MAPGDTGLCVPMSMDLQLSEVFAASETVALRIYKAAKSIPQNP